MQAAAAIRSARRASRLTQSALAARAGTSQAAISAYESRSKQPSVETLDRLLRAAGYQLAVEPASPVAREPSAAELTRAGTRLAEVMALAEALPVRHSLTLAFPALRAQRPNRDAR